MIFTSFVAQPTLKISDHDFVVIGAGEQIVSTRREAHRTNVAGVRAIRLDAAPASDVIQHAATVLQSGGHEPPTGVHCH